MLYLQKLDGFTVKYPAQTVVVDGASYRYVRAGTGHILLILPNQDFFSGKMQQDLIKLMHDPKIRYVSGGHLGTVLKAEDYVKTIEEFGEGLDK